MGLERCEAWTATVTIQFGAGVLEARRALANKRLSTSHQRPAVAMTETVKTAVSNSPAATRQRNLVQNDRLASALERLWLNHAKDSSLDRTAANWISFWTSEVAAGHLLAVKIRL